MRFIFGIFSLLPCLLFAQNSVLSEGNWYKLGITQAGIHKITAQNLRDLGIDLAQINPQKIAIYGNGGGMLPQANNIARYQDLQENAIWVVGEQDGRFDDTDYILFYAQNADKWSFDEPNNRFVFEKNVYSDKNYYFLTIKNSNALRIQNRSSVGGASQNVTIFDDYLSHEEDSKNVLSQEGKGGSGREWYGEFFNGSNQVDINQEVEGIVPNTPLLFTSSVLSQAFSNTSFQVSLNGYAFATQTLPPIVDATYSSKGIASTEVYTLNSNQIPNLPQLNVNYTYSQQGLGVRAYLNYFRIQCQRYLRLYNNQTRFRSLKSLETSISNFIVENTNSDTKIWDITNPLVAENQEFSLSSSQATFGANTEILREFVVWQGNDFPSPELLGSVGNQNLRALNTANLIIITHPDFRSEAERLADFRRSNDGLSVLVVDIFQIYNEFSSGKQDVSAIRDFVRHLYLKNTSETKYLLLFGATSFD
ncbi:MAG: C25 family cysteine peptidase, partial [Thermonemataceae bacterium]|nr:C25 family cysteine peptidase [Thermonemataceae bacterium]